MRLDRRNRIRTAARRESASLPKERTDESPITLDRDDEKLGKRRRRAGFHRPSPLDMGA
jgi:hypothetical protein